MVEEESMEIEISQFNRNLSRVVSQESLNSMSSSRLCKNGIEGDPDFSGNETRSMVSSVSTRSMANKRKRAVSNNGSSLENKRSKESEKVVTLDSEDDDEQSKSSKTVSGSQAHELGLGICSRLRPLKS